MKVASSESIDSYLVLLPRGLHLTAIEYIYSQFSSQEEKWSAHMQFLGEMAAPQNLDPAVVSDGAANCFQKDKRVGAFMIREEKSDGKQREVHGATGYTSNHDSIWTIPSQHELVWMLLETNAPASFVLRDLRGLGTILALVGYWQSDQLALSLAETKVDTVVKSILDTVYNSSNATGCVAKGHEEGSYHQCWDIALRLWRRAALASWEDCLGGTTDPTSAWNQHMDSSEKVQSWKLSYRLSSHRVDSKKYSYSRQALLAALGGASVSDARWFVPHSPNWKVDLSHYDLEVVVLQRPPTLKARSQLAIALSLRPYQHWNCKSFSTGVLPPDGIAPHLSYDITFNVIRLRPSTAQLLLHECHLQQGEVLLDPCAGVGTVPFEAANTVVRLGGDLALQSNHQPTSLLPAAAEYEKQGRRFLATGKCRSGWDGLMACDACWIPIRAACVDVICSDLPFGNKCLSRSQMDRMLPLLLREMARVLVPNTGRVVLLCGSHLPVLEALLETQQEGDNVWKLPCTAVFPVNIGGLMAWVIKFSRGSAKFRSTHEQHAERVRNMTRKRQIKQEQFQREAVQKETGNRPRKKRKAQG